MSSIKIFAIIISLFVVYNEISGQTSDEEPGAPKNNFTESYFMKEIRCNEILIKSIIACKDTHLPLYVILSNTGNHDGLCCAYSKYRECINELKTGLNEMMEKEKCTRSDPNNELILFAENVVAFTIRAGCFNNDRNYCLRSNSVGDN